VIAPNTWVRVKVSNSPRIVSGEKSFIEALDDGVERYASAGQIVPTVALFDVFFRHQPNYSWTSRRMTRRAFVTLLTRVNQSIQCTRCEHSTPVVIPGENWQGTLIVIVADHAAREGFTWHGGNLVRKLSERIGATSGSGGVSVSPAPVSSPPVVQELLRAGWQRAPGRGRRGLRLRGQVRAGPQSEISRVSIMEFVSQTKYSGHGAQKAANRSRTGSPDIEDVLCN
jgi:hypothetical protein